MVAFNHNLYKREPGLDQKSRWSRAASSVGLSYEEFMSKRAAYFKDKPFAESEAKTLLEWKAQLLKDNADMAEADIMRRFAWQLKLPVEVFARRSHLWAQKVRQRKQQQAQQQAQQQQAQQQQPQQQQDRVTREREHAHAPSQRLEQGRQDSQRFLRHEQQQQCELYRQQQQQQREKQQQQQHPARQALRQGFDQRQHRAREAQRDRQEPALAQNRVIARSHGPGTVFVQAVLLDESGAPQGFAGGMGGGGGATERDIQEYNGVRAVGRAGGVSWEAFLSLSTEDNTERVLRGFASARLAARAFDVLVIQQLERKLRAVSASSENDLASRRANLETHARRMCNFPEHFDAARDILHVTEVQQGARGLATSVSGLPAASMRPAVLARPDDARTGVGGSGLSSCSSEDKRKVVACFRAVLNGESQPNALFWDVMRRVVVFASPDSQRQHLEVLVQTPQQRANFLQYLDESILNDRLPADKVNVIRQIFSQSSAWKPEGGGCSVDEGDRSPVACDAGESRMAIDAEGPRGPEARSTGFRAVCNVYHVEVADDETQGEGEGNEEGGIIRAESQQDATLVADGEGRIGAMEDGADVEEEAPADRESTAHGDLDGAGPHDAATEAALSALQGEGAREDAQDRGGEKVTAGRSNYKCGICGNPDKKGHTCPGPKGGLLDEDVRQNRQGLLAKFHRRMGVESDGPEVQEDETARAGTSRGGTGNTEVEAGRVTSQEDDSRAGEGRTDRQEHVVRDIDKILGLCDIVRDVGKESGPGDREEACAEMGERDTREHACVTEGDATAQVQGGVEESGVQAAGAETVEATDATVEGAAPFISADMGEVKGKMEVVTVTSAGDGVATTVNTAGEWTVDAHETPFDSSCGERDRLVVATQEGTVEEGVGTSAAETSTVCGKTRDGTEKVPFATPLQTKEEAGRGESLLACKREEGVIKAKEEQSGPGGRERGSGAGQRQAKLEARQKALEQKQKKKMDMMANFHALKTELEEAFQSANASMDEESAERAMEILESITKLVHECSNELDLIQTKWRLMQRDATTSIPDVKVQASRTAATMALELKTSIQTLTQQYIAVCEQYTQALQQMCVSGDGEESSDGADAKADALCEEKRRLQTLLTKNLTEMLLHCSNALNA